MEAEQETMASDKIEDPKLQKNSEGLDSSGDRRPVLTEQQALLRDLDALSGRDILDRILNDKNPQKMVQELPSEDFFWLLRRVGEDDSLPLLQLASADQWQYLLA